MATPSMLIFTNRLVLRLSDFAAILSSVVSSGLVSGFDKLLPPAARFFLNEPIGGHPTTGASAVLLLLKQNLEETKRK